jgi:hypothetical protein
MSVVVLLLLFVVVGMVVSLDVAGLTLSKSRQFHESPRQLTSWALSNAAWHSGLLLIYIFAISGLVRFVPSFLRSIPDLLNWIAQRFPVIDLLYLRYVVLVTRSLTQHASVILGLIALGILWLTYSSKVISRPGFGGLHELPPLARLVFDVVDLMLRLISGRGRADSELVRILFWQAQAALVAVDMLALATLLKAMHLLDTWQTCLLVCIVVFVCVAGLATLAGRMGMRAYRAIEEDSSDPRNIAHTRNWILVSIRLAEPYLIFYFALQLVAFLIFGEQIHSVTFFFAAALLVFGLVARHSLPVVVAAALSEGEIASSAPEGALRTTREVLKDAAQVLRLCIKAGFAVVGAVFLFAGWPYLKALLGFGELRPNSISLEFEISGLMGALKGIAAFSLLLRIKQIERVEDAMVRIAETIVRNGITFLFVAGALFIAAVFPLYDQALHGVMKAGTTEGFSLDSFGFVENHRHVLQIGLWLLYLLVFAAGFAAVRSRWSDEIDRVTADTGDARSDNFWRRVLVSFWVMAAIVLQGVGYLQRQIAN